MAQVSIFFHLFFWGRWGVWVFLYYCSPFCFVKVGVLFRDDGFYYFYAWLGPGCSGFGMVLRSCLGAREVKVWS